MHLEREKGSLLPLDHAVGGFSASFFAIVAKWRRRYTVTAMRLHRNGNAITP